MTTEIEKQFFNTFGIEPKYAYLVTDMFYTSNSHNYEATKNDLIKYFSDKNCGRYKVTEVYKTYPQITDRILLELMELLMKQQATEFYYNDEYLFSSKLLGSNRPTCNKVKNLRELVLITANCLGGFTPLKNKMLKQVRALFEGSRK